MNTAGIISLVMSIISVTASVTMSFLVYYWSKKDTSTDYKIKDEIIKELLDLEGNLNSICVKVATRHMVEGQDIEKEKAFIKDFLTSPTMSFILSYDDSEKDKLFYLDLLLISSTKIDDDTAAQLALNVLEMLHNICRIDLIGKLKRVSSNDCLRLITNNKAQVNWLLQTSAGNVERAEQEKASMKIQKLRHIKSKGVSDPIIDLFLYIDDHPQGTSFDKKEFFAIKDACLKEYGTINVTDLEIINKYADYLKDFKYETL